MVQPVQVVRNFKSSKHTLKRLEDAAISSRSQEKVQLLQRWLTALKESDKFSAGSTKNAIEQPSPSVESKDSPKNPSLVCKTCILERLPPLRLFEISKPVSPKDMGLLSSVHV
ncbi:hypothetical protein MKX01_026952 [Papaver californicum]|nr:hypothetical protein MKX01_026952 [Papaver californicum]